MSGVAVLLILAGCVVAWSGYNDLPFWSVVRAAMSKTGTIPAYSKGAGAEKAIAEVVGFELVKAAASGVSALLPAGMLAAAGKGGTGGGGSEGDTGDEGSEGDTGDEGSEPNIGAEGTGEGGLGELGELGATIEGGLGELGEVAAV
ncbi:MAG: hypothetical protein ABSE66_09665 [Thermoplasmata archaeon]|jgi:hypothetical protein